MVLLCKFPVDLTCSGSNVCDAFLPDTEGQQESPDSYTAQRIGLADETNSVPDLY